MAQQSLVEYVQKLLKQGYDSGTIRTTLLNAGYSPYDVDAAMRAASGVPVRRISTQFLVVAFLILLVLAFGTLILLRVAQPPPIILSFSLELFSTEVGPGQDLVVNADIQNPSGRKTSGLIDYVVTGPGGRIASKTESFTLTGQTSVPSSIPLLSPPPGTYALRATLSYDGKSVSDSVNFEVVEMVVAQALPAEALKEREVEAARELQLKCPGNCDDLNFCTSDACVQGSCVNNPIVPCCGNHQCEPGETASSCLLDCGERSVAPEEIIQKAKELATSDLSKALETCESLAQRKYVDACLSDVAEAGNNKEPCVQIVDDDLRDGCYMTFAFKNDFEVCPHLTNTYVKNSCFNLAATSKVSS